MVRQAFFRLGGDDVQQLLQEEQQRRLQRTYSEIDTNLIQEGGYVSPNDDLWNDVLISAVLKKPILLKGPSGSGKTRLAQSISNYFQQPMQSINCSVDLDAEALIGFKTIIHQHGEMHIEFIDGPVIKAMKEGHILYIDEINMAKPETLPILHSVLDHRRMLTNPFTGEVLVAHKDFTVVAAINEGYVGTSPMNEALKNRFVSFSIPYIQGELLRKVLKQQAPQASDELIHTILTIDEDLKNQVQNGLLAEEAASVRSLIDTLQLANYMPLQRAARYAIAEKLEDQMERQLVMELLTTWIK